MVGNHGIGVGQQDEGFRVAALFYLVDALNGLFVGCVAAQSPNGVGGVDYDSTFSEGLHGLVEVGLVEGEVAWRGFNIHW